MTETLVLTFAEIEFLLQSRPPQDVPIREQLDLCGDSEADAVARAGVSSLLARGLWVMKDEDVELADELLPVILALSSARTSARAVSWVGERMTLVHFFVGSEYGVVLFPAAYGQYLVRGLDVSVPLSSQIVRFVTSSLDQESGSTVMVQVTRDGEKVSAAAAKDEKGSWYLSDSQDSPDRSIPSTRDAVMARLEELFEFGQAVGVR